MHASFVSFYRPDQVKQDLDDYFQRSMSVIEGHNMDQELCLLCIQCFEVFPIDIIVCLVLYYKIIYITDTFYFTSCLLMQDAVRKRVNMVPIDNQAIDVGRILEYSYRQLQEHLRTPSVISLQYLEAVAGVRFALSVLAQLLEKNGIINMAILRVARDLCMDDRLNIIDPSGRVDTTGPVLYLVKLLVRQFGFPCLKRISQAHPWVVPEGLRRADNVSTCTYIIIFI